MKKIISLLFLVKIISCSSEIVYPKQYIITAKSGLNLRIAPNTKSIKVATIPFGSKVLFIQSGKKKVLINNKEGYWYKIKWNNTSGWAFSPFLTENRTSLNPITKDIKLGMHKREVRAIMKRILGKDPEIDIVIPKLKMLGTEFRVYYNYDKHDFLEHFIATKSYAGYLNASRKVALQSELKTLTAYKAFKKKLNSLKSLVLIQNDKRYEGTSSRPQTAPVYARGLTTKWKFNSIHLSLSMHIQRSESWIYQVVLHFQRK